MKQLSIQHVEVRLQQKYFRSLKYGKAGTRVSNSENKDPRSQMEESISRSTLKTQNSAMEYQRQKRHIQVSINQLAIKQRSTSSYKIQISKSQVCKHTFIQLNRNN